jgi:hypothetical protein
MSEVLLGAPWWRCLHCGCDEYEEHVFTGHMKGVPMIHCANCEVLHSPPDADSKTALRWRVSELADALQRIADMTDIEADFDGFEARQIAEDALRLASVDGRRMAETGTGSVRSTTSAVPEGETPQ